MLGFVEHIIEGKPYALPELSPEEIIELATKAYAIRRESLIRDLDAAGVTPEARLVELNKLRELDGSHLLIFMYLRTVGGAREAIDKSLAKMSSNRPVNWNPKRNEAADLATRLCGYEINVEGKTEDEDNDGFKDDRPI